LHAYAWPALIVVKEYVEEAKSRGLTTIDELLEDMKIKDGQAE
jgi:hypothetical protein